MLKKIEQLFPMPIGLYEMDRVMTEGERLFLKNRYAPGTMRVNSGNSASKDTKILDNRELAGLKGYLTGVVNEVFREIHQPADRCELYITQSWLNLTTRGQWHHSHIHGNSLYSATLYLSTGEGDSIEFVRPLTGHNLIPFYLNPSITNWFNCQTYSVGVHDNALVIFPSTLIHQVPEVRHDTPRVSLSFNTFIRGEIGVDSNLTGLTLS
jgi:uncharacterized protein (TIGR02466 family)